MTGVGYAHCGAMAQSPRHPRTPSGAAPSKDHWLLTERSPDGPAAPFVARIAAVGRRLPATHLTSDELMGSTRHHTRIDLERLTGIHERRVSVGDEDSLSLAVGAARDCLARSGRRARRSTSSSAAASPSTAMAWCSGSSRPPAWRLPAPSVRATRRRSTCPTPAPARSRVCSWPTTGCGAGRSGGSSW